ncbi:MAG: PEP-CTERM/exosortase system-associated acyltransferase [Rhodocyclaceae bacterium]|nr:PEP-CTERM/exosortase system-associated acyltransferase [Rhodocyclaceae bacterium]
MALFDQFNLGNGFSRYFRIRLAAEPELRNEVFRIRHDVYCRELGYEAERDDGMETDEYDAHSQHCLLVTASETPAPVGCNRIVLARPTDPDYPLPFERFCEATLDRRIIDPAKLPRSSIAEVSRLAVKSQYRRRRSDERAQVVISDEDYGFRDRPRFPYIPVGLYLGAVCLADRQGIETLFVLTEPRLAAHFGKLGVKIRQIGEPVDHRGLRVPSMMDVQSIIKGMRWLLRPIWETVKAQIEAGHEEAVAGSDGKPAAADRPATG